ncbi:MAG: S-layer protein, partial [Clostridiaceae bacterium]|nr:S-layer protein [Clostridiaceae bacterium]
YEVASAVARALAVVDMTKASKQDVEMLKKLVVEFKDELDALGVKVDQLDSRVAVLEEGVGGWKISGSFRFDWKWAGEEGRAYTRQGDQDFELRRPNNWLQLVKRIDDKVTYRARLRRHDAEDNQGLGIQWIENFITVKFPWDITAMFGKTSWVHWEDGLFHPTWGDDASFMADRFEGMVFDKPYGMGVFSFIAAHNDANGGKSPEATHIAARAKFNINEQFSFGIHGIMTNYDTNGNYVDPMYDGLDKWSTYWASFSFNFTPDAALRGAYAVNKYDWVAGSPMATWDDSPKMWKAILDINQNVLKFTNLWVEYAHADGTFAIRNHGLQYGQEFNGPGFQGFNRLDAIRDNNEMKYLLVVAEQKWSDKWSTFLRYADVKYDNQNIVAGKAADSESDHTVWTVGARYMYTPTLQFELLYEKLDADWDEFDDNVVRLRTSVSF